jgi:rhamnosyltransferase
MHRETELSSLTIPSMAPRERYRSVCAVIVTYRPGVSFEENVLAIASQGVGTLVIDNGSGAEMEQRLYALADQLGCKVICNHRNLGIAAALNLGLKYALESGFDWVCTFDQDSLVDEDFFSKMLATYEQAQHREMISLIAPSYVDRETGIQVRLRRSGSGEILAAMTSGSMMPVSAIRKLGFFDESLFIDAVDKEYCLRARRNGMQIVQSPAVLMHSLGRTTYHRVLGLRFGATNHSVGRRYYIARNSLRVLLQYADDWTWVWKESLWMVLDTAKVILVEHNKWKKLRATASGITDAMRGRMGKQIEL